MDRRVADFRIETPEPGLVDIIFSQEPIASLTFLDVGLSRETRPLTDRVRVIIEL